jgi:hypothetical protein
MHNWVLILPVSNQCINTNVDHRIGPNFKINFSEMGDLVEEKLNMLAPQRTIHFVHVLIVFLVCKF